MTYTTDELLDLFRKTKDLLPKIKRFDSIIDSEPELDRDIKRILTEQDTDFHFDIKVYIKLANILQRLEKQAKISHVPFHIYNPNSLIDFHKRLKKDQGNMDKAEIKYNIAAIATFHMQINIVIAATQKIIALSERK